MLARKAGAGGVAWPREDVQGGGQVGWDVGGQKGGFEKQQPFAGQEREAGPGEPGTARNASLATEPSVSSVRH